MSKLMDKKTRKLLIYGFVVLAIVALVGGMWGSLEVLSVDRIWLEQRGVGEAGEELQGGFWRVTATTSDTKVRFLRLDEDQMKLYEKTSDDFPSDVLVNGEIYVTVSQPYNPYWVIPVKSLGTVEVVPAMQGVKLSTGFSGDYRSDAVKVHLWSLDLSQKKVVIPFEVTAAKLLGENSGFLKTDDPRAKQITGPEGYTTFLFSISQSDITDGQLSEILFYNPLASEETLKVNLLWTFGDYDKYSWNENLLFITSEDVDYVTPQTEITFLAADESDIRRELNWKSGDGWTYMRYWYGGGLYFKGTSKAPGTGGFIEFSGSIVEDGGKSSAQIVAPPYVFQGKTLLSEGYVSGATQTTGIYQYPGWYTPKEGCVENPTVFVSDWHFWRYPLTPNVRANTQSQPDGLSILNYLPSSVVAPVSGLTHTPFSRQSPDVWGEGCGGTIGVNGQIGVLLPTAARSWLFTLDVSTELADTVVVRQDYIDVSISKSLTFDQYTLNAGETAIGTVTLKNNSPFGGVVSVYIESPDSLKYTTSISGTDGALFFAHGEEKALTVKVTNNGLLDEEASGTFKFSVTNQQPRETASQTFKMTFKPGLGVANSLLAVTTKDADSEAKLSGINIRASYGVDGGLSRTGSTENGECVLDLGKYEGPVTVSAVDYSGKYESEETVVQVQPGTTALTLHLIPVGSGAGPEGVDWFTAIVILGVGVAVVFALMSWRKRK